MQTLPQRILIVSDAWSPQVNGVVTTLRTTADMLRSWGHTVEVIGPDRFRNIPLPSYPEIRLALFPARRLRKMIRAFKPDALHIATEGPLGLAARRFAARRFAKRKCTPFTTAYHTQFPEYVNVRLPFIPLRLGYAWMRWFHGPATATMVATDSMEQRLTEYGMKHLVRWGRGVDTELFKPERAHSLDLPRPIHLYVGRVAPEKNIEAFLKLDLPGSKLVVGDGPSLETLKARYPDVHFAGYHRGADLAGYYAAADVMVFPSLTDTFGLVVLEAMACGTPVAALPAPGSVDQIIPGVNGSVQADLKQAIEEALAVASESCRRYALERSWEVCTRQFLQNLQPAPEEIYESFA
jgi:glycosyltransferase involved in cell wall biosynthesis